MENVADALKISFAVLVFVVAVALTFSMISKAKATSDIVLYHTDKTNFYELESSKDSNRKVDLGTVISTLYKSMNESITVSIKKSDGSYFGYNGKTKFTANSEDEINEICKLLNEDSELSNANASFEEDFIEIPFNGIYKTADDGSEITVQTGQKQIYITYIYKEEII